MFAETLNSYRLCCKRYAAAYPDAVGASNLQHLSAVGGALSSLGSVCATIIRNAQDRASTLAKLLSGREGTIDELLRKIDAELGCDVSHGFLPLVLFPQKPHEGNSPTKDDEVSQTHVPHIPPAYNKRPQSPANNGRGPSSPVMPTDNRLEVPSNISKMPVPKILDETSTALEQRYKNNFDHYSKEIVGVIKSCDIVLQLHDEIVGDLQNAQKAARELDSLMRCPELAVDAVNKKIATRAALVRRAKDARKKAEILSSRFAQRQAIHFTDRDICDLENVLRQYQATFEGKRWFCDLQNKIGSFRLLLSNPEARAVASRLQRLNSTLNNVLDKLNTMATRLNVDIETERVRRKSVADVRRRLDEYLRAAETRYRRMTRKEDLTFHAVSTSSGTGVMPSLEALRKAVSSIITPLWQQLTASCREIHELQKMPKVLSSIDLNRTKAFPAFVIIGDMRIQCGSSMVAAPILTTFPFTRPRLFKNLDEIAPFLLRLMYAVPVGGIRLNVIDHASVGAHGRDFNQLLDVSGEVVKIITSLDDIRSALQDVLNYMGELTKTRFTGEITNWREYNKKNPQASLPCTILVIYSFKGWEYREFELIEPILERGAQCGVFVVSAAEGLCELDDRSRKNIKKERFAIMPPDLAKSGFAYKKLCVSWLPIEKPSLAEWEKLISAYKTAYEDKTSRTSHGFADLYSGVPMWSCNSAVGLDAIIGWDASDAPLHMRLGFGKEGLHHALMGGRNGSGKSNLLHVIIRSLCYRYSPEELTLYLLDFKDGVEFFSYSTSENSWLPHARTISVHNDPDYALAMFEALASEMEKRNEIFKSVGVVGLEEYRIKTRRTMSRILIIIDEFTVMFSSEESKERIGEFVSAILKRGRSTGIHLVLSTQTVASFGVRGAEEMFQQLAVRLALPGDGSECILSGMDHSEVRTIRIPQCIYNDNAGSPGYNRIFVHPQFKVDDPTSSEFRKGIEAGVDKLGGWMHFPCRVFNGTVLPPMPPKDRFNIMIGKAALSKKQFAIVLGIHSDFAGGISKTTFDDDASEDHLLVAYEKDDRGASKGLRQSILRSIAVLRDKAVLIYDPKRSSPFRLPADFDVANADTDRNELLVKLKKLRDSASPHRVLIVENFDSARYLHQKNVSAVNWGDDDVQTAETTDSLFKAAFEDQDKHSFHVICFTHRVRFAMEKLGNGIVSKFSKKIAFRLNGDDLIELMPQARGINVQDKVLFCDETSPDGIISILPYKSTL